MTVVLCVDDRGGVMFHSRRQSQDREVRAKLWTLLGDKTLLVSPYTAKQFSQEEQKRLQISDECYAQAGADAVCFAEDCLPDLTDPGIHCIILFRWNRVYPADRSFDLAQLKNWKCTKNEEFAGYSHEKITMEVYER